MVNKLKRYGQFFTPPEIAKFMVELIDSEKHSTILEPCAGKGIFLRELSKQGFQNIDAYEIDSTLPNMSNVEIKYQNFLSLESGKKYNVIIGNPPYVRWKNIPEEIKEVFSKRKYWEDKINGLSDLLYAFIYQCVDMLEDNGELIFITPSFWKETLHPQLMRTYLLERGILDTIITFNEMRIFKEVSSSIMIFKYIKNIIKRPIKVVKINSKKKLYKSHLEKVKKLLKMLDKVEYIKESYYEAFINQQFSNGEPWKLLPPHIEPMLSHIEYICTLKSPIVTINFKNNSLDVPLSKLFKKYDIRELDLSYIKFNKVYLNNELYYFSFCKDEENIKFCKPEISRYTCLSDVAEIGNGLVSGLDKAFKVINEHKYSELEKNKFVRVIKAANLKKYYHIGSTPYIFINDISDEKDLYENHPNIYNKISAYKPKLKKRYSYNKNIPWWHWVFLRNYNLIKNNKKKILTPCKERFDSKGYVRFTYAEGDYLATQDVTVIVKKAHIRESIKYILALLNSSTIFTWLKYKGLRRGGVLEFSERPLSRIPIRMIDWDNPNEVALHNEIIDYIDYILKTRKLDISEKIEEKIRELYGLR